MAYNFLMNEKIVQKKISLKYSFVNPAYLKKKKLLLINGNFPVCLNYEYSTGLAKKNCTLRQSAITFFGTRKHFKIFTISLRRYIA